MEYMMEDDFSPYKMIVLTILTIIWIAGSYGAYLWLPSYGFPQIWQIVIIISIFWLFFVAIARGVISYGS